MTITIWPHFLELRVGALMLLVDASGAMWATADGVYLRTAHVGRC